MDEIVRVKHTFNFKRKGPCKSHRLCSEYGLVVREDELEQMDSEQDALQGGGVVGRAQDWRQADGARAEGHLVLLQLSKRGI
jgi:hypothetical protein